MDLKNLTNKQNMITPFAPKWELIFRADNVPGFGFKSFYVSQSTEHRSLSKEQPVG